MVHAGIKIKFDTYDVRVKYLAKIFDCKSDNKRCGDLIVKKKSKWRKIYWHILVSAKVIYRKTCDNLFNHF